MAELPQVAPGEIVASSHINDLNDRVVSRYANALSRDTENPSPIAGDVAFLEDVNVFQVFNGSIWGSRLYIQNGTNGAPALALSSDPSTGIYRSTGGQLSISASGVQALDVNSERARRGGGGQGAWRAKLDDVGSEASPSHTFEGDTDSGMYRVDADSVGITAGGTSMVRMSTTGFVAVAVDSSTTGNAANVVVATGGQLQRSTSARKYKSNIMDGADLAGLSLEPVTFHHDGDGADYIGFIADDMPDDRMIQYQDGEVENYDVRAVVAVLAAKVNALTVRLEALED